MKRAEEPRSAKRAIINEMANGYPPYTAQEAQDNKFTVNVNFLDHTVKLHDADRQFQTALKSPSHFFAVDCDYGPVHKRSGLSTTITKRINFYMKRSLEYSEMQDGVIGNLILHGPGPSAWIDRELWCPDDLCIGDVLVPDNTKRSLRNLEKFGLFRKWTVWDLWRMTHGPKVDKAWNMPLVEKVLKWCHENKNFGLTNDMTYTPEKLSEEIKANGGSYAGASTPTIDVWDFYFLNDSEGEFGWNRRILIDSGQSTGNKMGIEDNEFLYDPGSRKYADKLSEILHVQFGDASRVPPYLWHSVRSLGWLLYSICHLQNRLRCKFNEHVFESLMQFFTCNPGDEETVKKLDLTTHNALPNGIRFMPRAERWSIDQRLVESDMMLNQQTIASSATSYTQELPFDNQQDKTATQFVGEQNATNAMVAAMLNRAYDYEGERYREICRRFCIPNSKDPDVRAFRNDCLKAGIPIEALDVSRWTITPEKVVGMGNQQLAMQRVNMLMSQFNRHDPESQRDILREFDSVALDDAARAERLVPVAKGENTMGIHNAQESIGSLMIGVQMHPVKGQNHIETVNTLLSEFGRMIAEIEQVGGNPMGTKVQGMATRAQVGGFQNMARYIGEHIQIIAQDPEEKARVAQYQKDLGILMNTVSAYGQRLQEQEQAQAQGAGQGEASAGQDAAGKAEALKIQTQAKIESQDMLAAGKEARTHQKWQADQERKAQAHQLDMANRIKQTEVETAATDIRTAAEIKRADAVAENQPKEKDSTE